MGDVSKVEELIVRKRKHSTLALDWDAPYDRHKTRRDVSRQME